MVKNRDKFNHKKMTELLNGILDKYMDNLPSQVQVNLPKLKKTKGDKNKSSMIKLPKLKKLPPKRKL